LQILIFITNTERTDLSTKNSFLRHCLRVWPFIVLLSLLSTTVWQCINIPPKPVLPNWDTQLSIPLVDTVYYLKDALKDSNITTLDSVYVYKPHPYNYAPVSIGDTSNLKLNPSMTDTTITKRIGKLRIAPPPPVEYQLTDSTLFSQVGVTLPTDRDTTINPLGPPPLPQFIPGFTYNTSQSLVFSDTSFDYITLSGGHMTLTVTNAMPTTMSVTIGLTNKFSGVITNLSLPLVNSYDSASTAQSLDGVVLTDSVTATIQFQISSTTLPAVFRANSNIGVRLAISDTSSDGNLSISEARLRIPSIEVQPDTTFTQLLIDQLPPTFVQQVLFKGGAISFSVLNHIDVGIDIDLRFKELHRNSDDSIFVFDPTISPLTALPVTTISLDQTPGGYHFESAGPSDDSLRVGLSIRTLELPYLSTVHETDSLSLSIHFQTPFYIKSVTGRLRPTSIPINERIAFPKNSLGSNFSALAIELPADTLLRLDIWTAAGQPIDFIGFRVRGIALNGTEIGSLTLPPTAPAPDTAWRFMPGQTNSVGFTGTQLNAFLKNFPGGQPDSLTFEGTALIDPDDVYNNTSTSGTVNDTMNIYTTANFMVPFKVRIDSGAFKDTVSIGNDTSKGPKVDKKLITSIVSGNLMFITTSTIPVHAGLRTYFLDSSRSVILAMDSVDIYPGINQYHTLRISRAQTITFTNASKAALKLMMDTQDLMATFDSTQYIRVRVLANIVFNVDPTK